MPFRIWCVLHLFAVQARLDTFEERRQRWRICAERQAGIWRLWSLVENR